ncbi:MAG: Protein GrpE [Mycoplasmataceae bacterium]|nr:MAG: Protein GrpE [Mycoplasmataceae bacterium]
MSKKELKEENNNSQENQENLSKNDSQKDSKTIDLEIKLKDLQDKNLRLMAQLQNQEKKHREEITEMMKYGNKKLLQQLLFFPDNYERAQQAIQHIEQSSEQDINILQKKIKDLFQGLQMILTWFQNTLQKQGVEEIETIPLKTIFDPELHISLQEAEENNDYPEGTILEVLQKGYTINQKVLRPTTVKISKLTEKNQKK